MGPGSRPRGAGTVGAPGGTVRARVWAFVRDRWLSIDLRTLGLFRIAFGLCLIANLVDHATGGNLTTFFSNDGVLTNHFALFDPIQLRVWSLLFAFSRPGEVAVAFAAILGVYTLYTIGWRTRVMQVIALICFISLQNRNLLLQDGGSFACSAIAVWTVFLPLGARFSVDAWVRRQRSLVHGTAAPAQCPPPRHVSFVCLALLLQLAVIYGFNAANKSGETWRGGSAVHYILWLNSRNTWLAGVMRAHEPSWFSPLLSRATLAFEWSAPLLALSPVWQTPLRRLLILGMWCFHLGIAALMSLGPFAYAMLTFSLLLLGDDDWKILEARARSLWTFVKRKLASRATPGRSAARWAPFWMYLLARGRARAVADESVPTPAPVARARTRWQLLALEARELSSIFLAGLMFVELMLANNVPGLADRLKDRPAWMGDVLYYLRVYQTWSMFAPDVPRDDGMIVVDAVLADGSHIDPLTGRAPDFESPLGGPCRYDHDWSEYTYYFPWERHRAYRDGFRDYIVTRTADWPAERKLRSFEVFWVSADLPPPGEHGARSLRRQSLIAYRP